MASGAVRRDEWTSMAGRRLALLLAGLGLLACTGSVGATTSAPVNGRLLIATGGRADPILDGLDLRTGDRLHLVPFGGTLRGAYSPDGTKIAFHTNYDGDYEICVENADGTHVRRLTHNSSTDAFPTWSPDGSQIAFESNRDGNFDIYVMNADGSDQMNLTNDLPGVKEDPHWSPDGQRIAFSANMYGSWDVWELELESGREIPLWQTGADEWFDSWSPDGSKFLVESDTEGDFDIYVLTTPPLEKQWWLPDPQVLDNDSAAQGFARWSPDGKQIAFGGNRDGDWEIYVMNADGTGERQVTHNKVDDILADWQPLHDTSAPKAHALVSDARQDTVGRLRFTTSDNTGHTSIYIRIFDGRRLIDYRTDTERRRIAGHVYSVPWRPPYRLSPKARFCVSAYDPSGNESPDSCAPIHVRS
jgi:Tol biopolymer transport system component